MDENVPILESRTKLILQKGSYNDDCHLNVIENDKSNANNLQNINTDKALTEDIKNTQINTIFNNNGVKNILTIENLYKKITMNLNQDNKLLEFDNFVNNMTKLKNVIPLSDLIMEHSAPSASFKIHGIKKSKKEQDEVDLFSKASPRIISIVKKIPNSNEINNKFVKDSKANKTEEISKIENHSKDILILGDKKKKSDKVSSNTLLNDKKNNSVKEEHMTIIKFNSLREIKDEESLVRIEEKEESCKTLPKGFKLEKTENTILKYFDKILKYEDKNQNNEFLKINDFCLSKSIISSSYENNTPRLVITICLLCDLFVKDKDRFKMKCSHILCNQCMKMFYEDKIERGVFYNLCPIFFCKESICPEDINQIITDKHKEKYEKIILEEPPKIYYHNEVETQFIDDKKMNQNNLVQYKNLAKVNVIDFNINETFYSFYKNKDAFCQKCGEPAIFSLSCRKYSKCLNCFNSICRHCFKDYSYDHYNLYSRYHCRIYFKKTHKMSDILKTKLKKNRVGFQLLCFFFAYFLMIFHILNEASKSTIYCFGVYDKNGRRLLGRMILYILPMILIMILWLIFCVLVIPFFPVIYTVFELKKKID